MKKFFSVFSLLAFLTVSTNFAWGDNSYSIGWGSANDSNNPYNNFTTTSGTVENVLTFSTDKGSSSTVPAYNASSNELRLYYNNQGNGGFITLTPATGVTITGFLMTTSTTPKVKYSIDGGTALEVSENNKTYTVSNISASTSVKIQNANTSNTQLRIKAIKITYTTSGDGTSKPTL